MDLLKCFDVLDIIIDYLSFTYERILFLTSKKFHEILTYKYSMKIRPKYDKKRMSLFVLLNKIDDSEHLITWACLNKFPISQLPKIAVMLRSTKILKIAKKYNQKLTSNLFSSICYDQPLQCIEWAYKNGCPNYTALASLNACKNRRIGVIKWMIYNNIPIHEDCSKISPYSGIKELIEFEYVSVRYIDFDNVITESIWNMSMKNK